MKKSLVLLAAAALPLGACTSYGSDNDTLASAGTGAAIGAAGGAGISAIAGGDLLTGAAIGAAVGGLAGAVWADRNGDGRADGYVYQNQYYEGQPSQYQTAAAANCPSVAGTAVKTGVAGAAVNGAHATMKPFHGPRFCQSLDITADGLQCGAELGCQSLGFEAAMLAHMVQHGLLSGIECHGHGPVVTGF